MHEMANKKGYARQLKLYSGFTQDMKHLTQNQRVKILLAICQVIHEREHTGRRAFPPPTASADECLVPKTMPSPR